MVKKKIGCSLPFNYLAGQSNTKFKSIFGPLDTFLPLCKSKGVASIELRSVNGTTKADDLSRALDKIQECGLSATIHGCLPAFNEPDPNILTDSAMSVLPTDVELIVTLHAYAGERCDRKRYAEETMTALRRLLANSPAHIVFALEINRRKPPRVDPGDDYNGVTRMVEEIDSPRVGACWDFGHSAANARNGFSDMYPAKNFLKHIVHTHIHDLSDDGTTHFPLTCGNLELKECVSRLLETGYEGCFNFEPDVKRWPEPHAGKRAAMLASIEILAAALEK